MKESKRKGGWSRPSEFMAALPLPLKATVITILTLLFSKIAIYDLMSISFFSPMEKSSDFRFSDFYALVADDGPVASHDRDIVIVPVDGMTRREMAGVLDDIDYCEPDAVGIDVAFSHPSNPDEDVLPDALANCGKLVMPVKMDMDEDGMPYVQHLSYYDSIVSPDGGFAAVNIQGDEEERSTVRDFRKYFLTGQDTVLSFGARLVEIARPEAFARMMARGEEEEAISFKARRFDVVQPDEIIDNPDLLAGKIVLVGKLMNAGDLHVTPVDNFTPGVIIHAYTTATMISGDFTRRLTKWETYLIAGLVCYLVVWLNLKLLISPVGPLVVRGLQLFLLYAMIIIGTLAYVYENVDLNFSYAVLASGLGVAACDVYMGFFEKDGLVDRIVLRRRRRKTEKTT